MPQIIRKSEERLYVRFASIQFSWSTGGILSLHYS
ncbi:hypothetical protein V6Z12_A06G132200 [Gossypium hirsutum]